MQLADLQRASDACWGKSRHSGLLASSDCARSTKYGEVASCCRRAYNLSVNATERLRIYTSHFSFLYLFLGQRVAMTSVFACMVRMDPSICTLMR